MKQLLQLMLLTTVAQIEPFLRPTSIHTVNAEVVSIERDGYIQRRLLHRMKSSINEKDSKRHLLRKRTMSGGANKTSSSEKRKFRSQYTFSFGGDSAPNTARSDSRDRQESRNYHKQDSKHVTFNDNDIMHSQTHSSKANTQ